ncbi:MAG TPA: hypothetical protein VN259_09070 [Xanthomonadales bacterium]|nr:hypothetical protein [Xanthomonadales bacterium]
MAANEGAKVKPANEVSLSFLVFTRGIPTSREIRLRDCGLEFLDENNHPVKPASGLISGVFGLASKQTALVVAAQWSKEREYSASGDNRVLLVDVNYKIDNYSLTRSQINSEILEKTGWLHMERIASKFRQEITEKWLRWIRRDYTDDYARILEQDEVSLLSLAQRHPKYVLRMMKEDPSIRAIVHPVRPAISPDVVLLAATVRYEPAYFGKALVRFTADVSVTI